MSLQEQQGYIFERDNIKQVNEHITQGVSFMTISDSNLGNFQNGNITFDGRTLGSAVAGISKMFELNQSYLTLPFGCVVKLDGTDTSFGTKVGNDYKFDDRAVEAISVKNFQHLFHNIRCTLGGKACLNGSDNINIFLTEKLKSLPSEKMRLISDFVGLSFDNSESYTADYEGSPVLEQNNRTISLGSDIREKAVNTAHLDRMYKSNRNFIDKTTGLYKMYSSSTIQYSHESGLIGVFNSTGQPVINKTSTDPITTLVFQYLVHVPLCLLSEFFAAYPSTLVLPMLNLTFNTNLSRANSWSVEYSAYGATTGIYTEQVLGSNASIGNACPFMVSQMFNPDIADPLTKPVISVTQDSSNKNVTSTSTSTYISQKLRGMPVWASGNAIKPKLTVTPYIGYYTPSSLPGVLNNVNNLLAPIMSCHLRLCTVAYSPVIMQSIMNSPTKMILYNQFNVDNTLVDRPGGSHCDTTLYLSTARLRKLYIVPHFSEIGKISSVAPRMSLISSCPNTSSFCRLTNMNISLGSVKILENAHSTLEDHFIHSHLISQAMYNGNAFTSDIMSGITTLTDWRSCYNSYVFDLQKARSIEEDDQAPSIRIEFDIDMSNTIKYNFFIFVEYQSAATVDRFKGQFESSETI